MQRKVFGKKPTTTLFLIKTLSNQEIENFCLPDKKQLMKNPKVNIIKDRTLFPLRSGTRRGYVLSSLQLSIALDVLVNATGQNNKINKTNIIWIEVNLY